jgi:lipopolysaccharide transport system ATP-binding protein
MAAKPIIEVQNLGKKYRLGHVGFSSLRDELGNFWDRVRGKACAPHPQDFWALEDVSFTVQPGEVLGILGHNGAGKSTLLKILARITEPTRGRVILRSRVSAMLEVGAGFHPELSGFENIYLTGATLGMKKREIDRKLDEIIAFGGIEKFLETPVKRYSSGMYVRLAFSVAAHLDPEILIVDEVLAVGDAAFQVKSLAKMEEIASSGKTVLFVSHRLTSVEHLCKRVIWIDRGRIYRDGEPECVIAEYHRSVPGANQVDEGEIVVSTPDLDISKVELRNGEGTPTHTFEIGEPLTVVLHYIARRKVEAPGLWIGVGSGPQFAVLSASMKMDGCGPARLERGQGTIECRFDPPFLLPGREYLVSLGGQLGSGPDRIIVPKTRAATFYLSGDPIQLGLAGAEAKVLCQNAAPAILPYQWVHPDGTVKKVRGAPANGAD